jgi:hypothetical protein
LRASRTMAVLVAILRGAASRLLRMRTLLVAVRIFFVIPGSRKARPGMTKGNYPWLCDWLWRPPAWSTLTATVSVSMPPP